MCARLYPNGDGIGKGSHVSLFFVLMKGPYDPILPWPFKHHVTMQLLDQSGQGSHIHEKFRADPNSSSFQQPRSEMNVATGCPRFISLNELERRKGVFMKDNTMFIRINVEWIRCCSAGLPTVWWCNQAPLGPGTCVASMFHQCVYCLMESPPIFVRSFSFSNTWFKRFLKRSTSFSMMTSSNGNIFRVTGPLCGEFTGSSEFPAQRPVTRSFDVFFDLRLNKRLSKQPWGLWTETSPLSSWRHGNVWRTPVEELPRRVYTIWST